MQKKTLLLTFILVLLYTGTVFSDASQIGTTSNNFIKILPPAKPAALGESYVALADDINAIFYNPAGIARTMSMQASFTHIQWFQQVMFESLNFVIPFTFGNLGFSLNYLSVTPMDNTILDVTSPEGYKSLGQFSPYSIYGSISYAREFTDSLFIGANIKILDYAVDPSANDGSALSFLADFGVIYDMTFLKGMALGLVFRNIGPSTTFISQSFVQPIDIRGGLGWTGQYFSLEGDLDFVTDNDLNYYFGGAFNMFDVLSLRAGYKGGTINQPTFGAGLAYARFALDYAFVPYATGDLGMTHRFTVSYQFGAPPAAVSFNPPVFSPNGDKYLDYTIINKDAVSINKVKSYTITIMDQFKNIVRTAFIANPNVRLFWNGANGINVIVPDGVYYASLKVNYGNGMTSDSNLAKVEVDNTPPAVRVDANPKLIKPGTMTILMCPVTFKPDCRDLHGIGRWKLVIGTTDRQVFKTFSGTGEPADIIWDGSDDTGLKTVKTGATYTYTMYAADTVGNWGRSQTSSVKVLLKEIVITLSADTLFDIGKADVKISVYKDIQKIADQIKSLGSVHVIVEGHTDNQPLHYGAYKDNMELSQYRARAVVKFFAELFDMDESRFTPVGKGDTQPVATNDTPEGRKLNRRVTIRIQASKWQ
jgi:flagellar motor protein MotB